MKGVERFFFCMVAFENRRCLFICNGIAYILCLDDRSAHKRVHVSCIKNLILLIEVLLYRTIGYQSAGCCLN